MACVPAQAWWHKSSLRQGRGDASLELEIPTSHEGHLCQGGIALLRLSSELCSECVVRDVPQHVVDLAGDSVICGKTDAFRLLTRRYLYGSTLHINRRSSSAHTHDFLLFTDDGEGKMCHH